MSLKRSSDDDAQHLNKIAKLEHSATSNSLGQSNRSSTTDFSGSVKKKLANSTRTGQACDRCKVRKIRCDGRPGGCSPCAQNHTLCKTTDRITGRATTRGHTEHLEAENGFLRQHIAELQSQLKDAGVEPKPLPPINTYASEAMQQAVQWPPSAHGNGNQSWGMEPTQQAASLSTLPGFGHTVGPSSTSYTENNVFRPLPPFKTACVGDNYLGVSSSDDLLSHIRGTSLSLFGTEIDITDFVLSDDEYNNSVMSYPHFLSVVFGMHQNIEEVPFPEYRQLSEYATWYLRSLNPYTMLLDKRAFTQLIWRIWHDKTFTPSHADIVTVHMMLAILKYQISMRNQDDTMMDESNKHYQYSLSLFKHLLHSHTLQDIQAMALICIHLRNFPKPGAAWIMSTAAFALAVELGLHRSAKAWADAAPKKDVLEVEMRKRTFWTLHALTSSLSGKLGRPMCIRVEDVDVEFPEPVEDTLPTDDPSMSPFHKCSFRVGIETSKYTVLSTQLYGTIYAVRQPPQAYEENVKRLEAGIKEWREQLPRELTDGGRANQETYIFARYLEFWDTEFQLVLHHPSMCRSTDPAFINSNLDKCLEASSKMLRSVDELRKYRSLDIPWVNCTVYIAAIFTTLFIWSQRRDRMTSADMSNLSKDMTLWIDVMETCGQLLGTGDKLKNAIQGIVEQALDGINDHIVKKTATEAVARAALGKAGQQDSAPPTAVYGNGTSFHAQYTEAGAGGNEGEPKGPPTNYLPPDDPSLGPSTSPYPPTPHAYGNGAPASVPGFQGSAHAFDQLSYAGADDPAMSAAHANALASAASGATSQRPESFIYPNAPASNGTSQAYPQPGLLPSDWRQFTRAFAHQMAPGQEYQRPQEYLNTANTLMALGGRDGSVPASGPDGAAAVEGSPVPGQVQTNAQWPVMLFGIGPNGHVGQQ